MAFTTWAALKQQILDELAAGSVLTKHYSLPTGASRTFADLGEVRAFLMYCDQMSASETSGSRINYVTFGRP